MIAALLGSRLGIQLFQHLRNKRIRSVWEQARFTASHEQTYDDVTPWEVTYAISHVVSMGWRIPSSTKSFLDWNGYIDHSVTGCLVEAKFVSSNRHLLLRWKIEEQANNSPSLRVIFQWGNQDNSIVNDPASLEAIAAKYVADVVNRRILALPSMPDSNARSMKRKAAGVSARASISSRPLSVEPVLGYFGVTSTKKLPGNSYSSNAERIRELIIGMLLPGIEKEHFLRTPAGRSLLKFTMKEIFQGSDGSTQRVQILIEVYYLQTPRPGWPNSCDSTLTWCIYEHSPSETKVEYEWTAPHSIIQDASLPDWLLINFLIGNTDSTLVRNGAHHSQVSGDRLTALALSWPSLQDYNEAIQNPATCFADQELSSGHPELNQFGLPVVATGAFASVYKLTTNGRHWAVRCFSAPLKDQEERYREISKCIGCDDLSYTVSIEFLERGMSVNGRRVPILKMEWVEGITLERFVSLHLQETVKLIQIRERFGTMMHKLHTNSIAHTDLQHGNIIIRDDEFVLVDYDSLYVPSLAGYASHELGHPNYQHPQRNHHHFGPYLDNFSAWVIDTALLSLIHDSTLWSVFGGDENLLFRRADFLAPESSKLFQALQAHKVPLLGERASLLQSLLSLPVDQVPPLHGNVSSAVPDWMS